MEDMDTGWEMETQDRAQPANDTGCGKEVKIKQNRNLQGQEGLLNLGATSDLYCVILCCGALPCTLQDV